MPVVFESVSTMTTDADSTTTFVITAPSGIADGDLLLAFVSAGRFDVTWTAPAGWTELEDRIHTPAASGPAFTYAWKRASSESGDYTWTASNGISGSFRIAAILRFSGARDADALHAHANANDDTGAITCPAVVTTVPNCMIVRACIDEDGVASATGPAGYTERADVDGAFGEHLAVYTIDTPQANPGSTGTADITPAAGLVRGIGITIAIAPALTPDPGHPGGPSLVGSVSWGLAELAGPDFRTFRGF